MKASFVVRVVRNGYGLHLRTANILAQKANQFKSGIWFFEDGLDEDAKSIKGVAFLVAPCGTEVTVKTRGEGGK